MQENKELVRLEQFVDNLLNKYNDLKEKYHDLEGTLRERDEECAALKDDIAGLNDERSEVGSRVAGLLGRIEQWETDQEETVSNDDAEDRQGSLFESDNEENS